MAAFKASRLVCSAMFLMTSRTVPMFSLSRTSSRTTWEAWLTCSARLSMVFTTRWKTALPSVPRSLAWAACSEASRVPAETSRALAAISSMAVATWSMSCCWRNMLSRDWEVIPDISPAERLSSSTEVRISLIKPCNWSTKWLNSSTSSPTSSCWLLCRRTRRSPPPSAISRREPITWPMLVVMERLTTQPSRLSTRASPVVMNTPRRRAARAAFSLAARLASKSSLIFCSKANKDPRKACFFASIASACACAAPRFASPSTKDLARAKAAVK